MGAGRWGGHHEGHEGPRRNRSQKEEWIPCNGPGEQHSGTRKGEWIPCSGPGEQHSGTRKGEWLPCSGPGEQHFLCSHGKIGPLEDKLRTRLWGDGFEVFFDGYYIGMVGAEAVVENFQWLGRYSNISGASCFRRVLTWSSVRPICMSRAV